MKKLEISGPRTSMGPENNQSKATEINLEVYYANVDNSLLSKIDELKALMSHYPKDIIALNKVKPKYGEIPSHEA